METGWFPEQPACFGVTGVVEPLKVAVVNICRNRMIAATAVAGAIAVGPWAGPASGAGCVDLVDQMAGELNLAVTPDDDGLIVPPVKTDPAVIEPALPNVDRPMLPDVAETPPSALPLGLSASDRAALQVLLVAARADAVRGDEGGCLVKMQRASRLVSPAAVRRGG